METDTNNHATTGVMLFYTDTLIDHFTETECNGYACVGDPGCGDELRLRRMEANE